MDDLLVRCWRQCVPSERKDQRSIARRQAEIGGKTYLKQFMSGVRFEVNRRAGRVSASGEFRHS